MSLTTLLCVARALMGAAGVLWRKYIQVAVAVSSSISNLTVRRYRLQYVCVVCLYIAAYRKRFLTTDHLSVYSMYTSLCTAALLLL